MTYQKINYITTAQNMCVELQVIAPNLDFEFEYAQSCVACSLEQPCSSEVALSSLPPQIVRR